MVSKSLINAIIILLVGLSIAISFLLSIQLVGASTCPSNIGVCDETIPFQSSERGNIYNNITTISSGSSYNLTYHNKADYNFGTNNFNGSGNFTTTNNISANGIYGKNLYSNQDTYINRSLYIRSPVMGNYYGIFSVLSTGMTGNRNVNFELPVTPITIKLDGSPTLSNWFDQDVRTIASPKFVNVNLTGNLTANGNYLCNSTSCFTFQELNSTSSSTYNASYDALNSTYGQFWYNMSLNSQDNLTIHDVTASGNLSVSGAANFNNVSISTGSQLGLWGSSTTYGAIPLYIGGTGDSYGRMASFSKTNYDLSTGNTKSAFTISAYGSTGGGKELRTMALDARYTGSGAQTANINAFQGQVYNTGTGNTTNSFVFNFGMYQASNSTATAFIGGYVGGYVVAGTNGTIKNYYGYWDAGLNHLSPFNSSRAIGFYSAKHQGNITDTYGAYLEKQTAGSVSNQGIYLAGDGVGSDIVFGVGKDSRIFWNDTNVSLQVTSNLRVDGNVYYDGLLISYSPTIFCSADEDMCMAIDYETKSQVWCSQSTGKCDSNYLSLTYEKLANSIQCTISGGKDCLETTSKQRIEDKLAKVKARDIEKAQFQLFEKSCENIGKQANSYDLWKQKPECMNIEKVNVQTEPINIEK